jgi:predicted RND superfamily exporter protein
MADLERSRGRRMSRSERSRRAYQLTLVTGGLAVVAVVGILLALFTSFGWGLPLLALVLAVLSGLWLRRTLGV